MLEVLRIGQGHGYPLQAKASLGSLAALIADMGRAKCRLGGQAVLSQYTQGGRLGSVAVQRVTRHLLVHGKFERIQQVIGELHPNQGRHHAQTVAGRLEHRLLSGPQRHREQVQYGGGAFLCHSLIECTFFIGERQTRKTGEQARIQGFNIHAEHRRRITAKRTHDQRIHLRHIEIHARNTRLAVLLTAGAQGAGTIHLNLRSGTRGHIQTSRRHGTHECLSAQVADRRRGGRQLSRMLLLSKPQVAQPAKTQRTVHRAGGKSENLHALARTGGRALRALCAGCFGGRIAHRFSVPARHYGNERVRGYLRLSTVATVRYAPSPPVR